ncbi:hypothetical protein AB0P28_15190 [Pseudarthrobacter sp. NPDC089323]
MPGYKSIPEHIIEEIKALPEERFQIGLVRVVTLDEIGSGKLAHLGVSAQGGNVTTDSPFIPRSATRWSKWNLAGRDIRRPDWPKQTRTWTTTSPNFGDGARYGYNSQLHSRDVMAKQTLHGKAFSFEVNAIARPDGKVSVRVMFEPEFSTGVDLKSDDLLMAVSLTREIAGTPRVFGVGGTSTPWSEYQEFDWEFLPEDHTGAPIADYVNIAATIGVPREMHDTFRERFEAIRKFQPISIRYGNTGFARYVAFEFASTVVLENYFYGNAAYVMYEDWQALSQRTRLDLLSDPSARFERVIHSKGWQARLKQAIKGERGITA